jgi:hypothetical protein
LALGAKKSELYTANPIKPAITKKTATKNNGFGLPAMVSSYGLCATPGVRLPIVIIGFLFGYDRPDSDVQNSELAGIFAP